MLRHDVQWAATVLRQSVAYDKSLPSYVAERG